MKDWLGREKTGTIDDYISPEKANRLYHMWIEQGLSVRAARCLANEGIATIDEIRSAGDRLLMIPNFGRATFNELTEFCEGRKYVPSRKSLKIFSNQQLINELLERGFRVTIEKTGADNDR